jgi:hypothetical protein
MNGRYICGDFESRRIWALHQTDRTLKDIVEIGRAPSRIVSFAEGLSHELYLIGYDNGIIYRMNLQDIDVTPRVVRIIAEIGQQGGVLSRYTSIQPAADWMKPDFDDNSWKLGPSGFGTAGTPGTIVRTDWNSNDIWIRRSFTFAEPPEAASQLVLLSHHDEDTEVFINGVEALRRNGWTSGYNEFDLAPEAARSLRPGRNVIAIHCRQNRGGQYIDAGIIEYKKSKAFPSQSSKRIGK